METTKLETETHTQAHVRKGLASIEDVAALKRAAYDCLANFRDAIQRAVNILQAAAASLQSAAKTLGETLNVAPIYLGEFQA